jgi:DNA-directed RNA polymerase specialized sigma24 family protein
VTTESWVAYEFAVVRAVPHVHLGAFVPVGVVVHARTAGFLAMRAITDPHELAARVPDVDHELLAHCMQNLAERERSVLVLTFYDEQTSEEVAKFLGISITNVRVVRHRALGHLRECLLKRGEIS